MNNNDFFQERNEKNTNKENNKNLDCQNLYKFKQNLDKANTSIPNGQNYTEEDIDIKPQKSEQITTKFFTDYGGYGYKCSCSKTQCNRYYCECYRSGLYCIDCNCKNCNNKPPENYVSNRHQTLNTQAKPEIVICTCTKSGCNKKYCECYKNGSKCTSSCRCVGCENSENPHNGKKNNVIYECCPANSIYIFKNEIFEEIINKGELERRKMKGKMLEKKRKRSLDEKNGM